MPYKPIEDYGIIGDLHSIALVGVDGSIDWCCLPNFDSPSVFGALLDEKQGGYFKIAAQAPNHAKQLYLPDTNVLITRIFSDQGIAEITDFMPIEPRTLEGKRPHCHQIIRRVHTVSGQIDFRLECFPAFDYARQSHQVRHYPQGAALVSSSASVGLVSRVPLSTQGSGVVADFSLGSGKTMTFYLRQMDQGSEANLLIPEESGSSPFATRSTFGKLGWPVALIAADGARW